MKRRYNIYLDWFPISQLQNTHDDIINTRFPAGKEPIRIFFWQSALHTYTFTFNAKTIPVTIFLIVSDCQKDCKDCYLAFSSSKYS